MFAKTAVIFQGSVYVRDVAKFKSKPVRLSVRNILLLQSHERTETSFGILWETFRKRFYIFILKINF